VAIQDKITYYVDYIDFKPETYQGVFAKGDDSTEIMRIANGDMEADYVTLKDRLKGTARLYTEDASVVNFRIDRDTPEKDRDFNLKRRN
jgi:hypothetical protein